MPRQDLEGRLPIVFNGNPGCPICPVCGVPSLAIVDGDECVNCGADIFEMARENRERAAERIRIRTRMRKDNER